MNVQEEVEQKTFNIVVSTTKLTARTILNAGRTALREYQSKLLADKSSGKQSVRMLLRQNRGVSSVEISKTGIRDFERYAKKYGIDYAIQKDTSEVPPRYLYEQGVVGRNNKNIPNTSIVRMIKNKGYTGYLINGAVETECPQLRIIEPELFEQAQELRQARTCERGGTSLGTSSKALLTGLVYCGHCGNRLSLTSSGRTHTYADGHTVKEVRPRYSCFYKIRHPGDCDGQSGYGVSKLDSIVEEVVRQIFAQFREVSRKKLLESVKTNDAARIQKKVKKLQKDLESKQKELDDLKAETILVIRGVSALDKELLGTLVAEAREALETLEKQLVQAQEEYEEATKTAKRSNYICNELFTWADVYDTANHDERRAILQQFIKEIRVRKDYEISITLNASFNQVEQLKTVSTYDGTEIFEEISEKGA